MEKSILIIGPQSSGKSLKLNEIVTNQKTKHYQDELISCNEMEALQKKARKEKLFCVGASQMLYEDLSEKILSEFEIINLHSVN